jgi:hypothetical protein
MNITVLLFNNRIYGLTKGQYSPTSEVGKVTKSTPMGSLDHPFNPVSVALGAEATFVGRALDSDRKGLSEVLRAAAAHRGAALVEILQDCPIFNDGSFDALRKEGAGERVISVRHGEPITFGADGEYCATQSGFGLEVAKTADVAAGQIVVHDAQVENPAYAFALSRLSDQNLEHTVMGIFRQVNRPAYDDAAWARGVGPLGYGDAQSTVVSYGADAADKYVTTWFRTSFEAADVAGISGLTLALNRDDGAVVYVNGIEVARSNGVVLGKLAAGQDLARHLKRPFIKALCSLIDAQVDDQDQRRITLEEAASALQLARNAVTEIDSQEPL